jgi:hypothetical protein
MIMIKPTQPTYNLSRLDFGAAALMWLLAFGLYVRTLAPSLLWDDSAEFQTLSYTLGMTHTTGYMTYLMIGKLFTKIPVGNIAYRVNLVSAFFGALAVAQVFFIARMLGHRRAAGISAALTLAVLERFWRLSLIAELYVVSAGIIMSIWLLMLLWNRTGKWGYIFAAGVLGGLSVGIHSTILLTAVSVLIYMTIAARKKSAWFGAAAGALLGLSLTFAAFLYVDANDPPSSIYNTVYRPSLSDMNLTPEGFDTPMERLRVIFPTTSRAGSYYFTAPKNVVYERLIDYVGLFPLWAVIFVPVGFFAIFLRSRWYDGLYPLVGFSLTWGFAIAVSFASYRDFYIPAAGFVVVWLSAGINILFDGVEALIQRVLSQRETAKKVIIAFISLLFVVFPVWGARTNIRMAIEKGRTNFILRDHVYPAFSPDKAINDARATLRRVDENAIVFLDWSKLYSFVYTAHIVEGRYDVNFHEADLQDDMLIAVSCIEYIDENIDTRPIYFTNPLEQVYDLYRVEQIDEALYRIYRK